MSKSLSGARDRGDTDAGEHIDGIEDGAGCTEIWEHLSERRHEGD